MALLKFKGNSPRDLKGVLFNKGDVKPFPDMVAVGCVTSNPDMWEIETPAKEVKQKEKDFAESKKYDNKKGGN